MSHVATIAVHITDLMALQFACEVLGLEFVEGQTTFRWYGTHIGDYPLPEGFTKEDMGRCDHAIRLPNRPNAYEVGVVRRRDGKPGFTLMVDFWMGGFGLEERIGTEARLLKQQYAAQIALRQVRKQGFRVTQTLTQSGAIHLQCSRSTAANPLEQIGLTIDPHALVQIEVKGHAGPGCQGLTEQIEKALGERIEDTTTHEFHQPARTVLHTEYRA